MGPHEVVLDEIVPLLNFREKPRNPTAIVGNCFRAMIVFRVSNPADALEKATNKY